MPNPYLARILQERAADQKPSKKGRPKTSASNSAAKADESAEKSDTNQPSEEN